MILFSIIPALIFSIIVCVNFFYFLINGRLLTRVNLFRITEIWSIIIAPVIFLSIFDFNKGNECCGDSAVFAPNHKSGIYILIAICMVSYFYSSLKKTTASPIIELVINSILALGIVLNILIAIQINTQDFGGLTWLLGNVPIIMLFILTLVHNQKLIRNNISMQNTNSQNGIVKLTLKILRARPILKFPVLLIIALPLTLIVTLLLYVFGQKPDTLIKAFTDTYKHGFSELDYMCDNVQCGGHYLCSVAANGHGLVVKPIRFGERNGNKIVCNRQLLVANAFEELIGNKYPRLHKIIRKGYDNVGNFIHSYYFVFSNKYFSDLIYFLMKPLEWAFLLTLYICYQKPENKIAIQYLSKSDRLKIIEI